MAFIFDIETNGLLPELNTIHCLAIRDTDTGMTESYAPHQIEDGLRSLLKKDMIVGHNVIAFDIPAIQKCFPWFSVEPAKVRDTLTMSRLIWSDISETDWAKTVSLPNKLKGSHSLAAWGHRLGCHKDDYQGGWEKFNLDMMFYCIKDTAVTDKLWKLIQDHKYPETAIELEHDVQWLIARQERHGFRFDEPKALDLCAKLQRRRAELDDQLQSVFSPWWSATEIVTPKRSINYKNKPAVTAGASYSKIKHNVFNPNSRHHIQLKLEELGWQPKEHTPDGRAKLDETILMDLSFPQGKILAEFFMIQKRLGMLSDGRRSWLGSIRGNRIHGSVLTNGTVTGRASMREPNLQQVPSSHAPFGKECRELFTVPDGKALVGVDQSGIELRMLGHFTAPFDGGAYAKEVLNGDIHTHNQKAAGLADRDTAKRFIYALVYGAGVNRLAAVTGLRKGRASQVKARFLEENKGLGALISAVQEKVDQVGYLKGLDQRRLPVRSSYRALNVLLQAAGAATAKRWLIEFDREVERMGWRDRVQQVCWIHDEIQVECDEDLAEEVGKTAVASIEKAGEYFNLRVPITGEFRVGNTWAETH